MITKEPGGASLYLQIAAEIKKMLLNCEFGEKIPSETELMAQYSVSRGTIRQAVECLVSTGDIYKLHGRGMYRGGGEVNSGFLNALPSLTSSVRRKGELPTISDVSLTETIADERIADRLSLPIGTPVWKLTRYRGTQNHKPHCYAEAHLPKAMLPQLRTEDLKLSLLDMLTKDMGLVIGSTSNSLYAASADGIVSKLLDVSEGSAIFVSEFVARNDKGRPFLFDRAYTSNSEYYRYVIESKYS